jgi:hypothetical protein
MTVSCSHAITAIQKLTSGPKFHFFGYYDKSPWDPTAKYLLCHETEKSDAFPEPDDEAKILLIDTTSLKSSKIGSTKSWNWQQGAMLQWSKWKEGELVVLFNVRTNSGYGCQVVRPTGETLAIVPYPIAAVVPQGRWALSMNFNRLYYTHQTIGYAHKGGQPSLSSAQDGLWLVDLFTSEARLIVTLDRLKATTETQGEGCVHWVTHPIFNPSGTRATFIHRYTKNIENEQEWFHQLITMDLDGENLRILESSACKPTTETAGNEFLYDYEKCPGQISHPMWKDDEHVLVWSTRKGVVGYHLYHDGSEKVEQIGPGVLNENGHFTYHREGNWLLSDNYPDKKTGLRDLFLYHVPTGTHRIVAQLYAPDHLGKHCRCDLHSRWSPDGKTICFDSYHEGERQMYTLDVSTAFSHPPVNK